MSKQKAIEAFIHHESKQGRIEAILSTKPKGMDSMSDLIDRQKAIEAFRPYAEYESNRSNADWVRRIELVLSELPSAEPDHWIFCKDQMPEIDQHVLLTLTSGYITIGWRWQEGEWFGFEGEDNLTDADIIAWMPLPSPPNE